MAGTPRKRRVTTLILISSSSESGSEVEHPSWSLVQKSSSQRMVPLPAYVVDGNEYAGRVTEPPPPRRREACASRTTPPPVMRGWGLEVSARRRAGAAPFTSIGTGTAVSSLVPTGPRNLLAPSRHSTSVLSTGPRTLSTASGPSTGRFSEVDENVSESDKVWREER
ncbi:hypothetical protein MMC31_000918 [Peltigera leucophlebia]|nr:hypothetical protein [Peltigera leucophlebia]